MKDDRSFDGSFGSEDLLPKTEDFELPPKRFVGEVGDPNIPFTLDGPALDGTIIDGFGRGGSDGSMISEGLVYIVPFDISSSSISSISTDRDFFFGNDIASSSSSSIIETS